MTAVLPDVAALELTYRCNHQCRFCSCPWYAGMLKPGPEMGAEEWRQLVCEFADQGVRQFADHDAAGHWRGCTDSRHAQETED